MNVPGADFTDGALLDLWDCNGHVSQDVTVAPDGTLRMGGKCLAPYGSTDWEREQNGTKLELWSCLGLEKQQWVYGETERVLYNPYSDKCLAVPPGARTNGTGLVVWDCHPGHIEHTWSLPAWGQVTLLGGKCLNVQYNNWYEAAPVTLYDCNGHESQTWTYDDATGNLRGKGGDGTLCLAAPGTNAGMRLQLQSCVAAAPGQVWEQNFPGGELTNPASQLCIYPAGGSTANETPLELTDCDSPPSTGTVVHSVSNKCMDVAGNSSDNGTPVQLWDCNGGDAQKWTLGNGTIMAKGKCLSIGDTAAPNGTKLLIWDCIGDPSQQWMRGPGGKLIHKASGRCLDLPSGNTSNGNQLQLWDCYEGEMNQIWKGDIPLQ